ncbi:hypothetical protein RP20_CCG022894, partial [Aedes albopictus]
TVNAKPLTFDEVYNQSSPTNCTVYCGGVGGTLAGGLSEEILQKTFSPFGTIQEIRVFKDKGYAFVRFSTKEAATHAIVAVHNSEINAQTVKCSWGKESGDPNNAPSLASQALSQAGFPFNTAYGQQVAGYWYPPAPTYPTTPAPAAAPLQSQFLQGMQGYTYGQFAGYQQGYMGMGMQLPGAWPGVPTQAQIPATAQQLAQAGVGGALPQAAGVVAYPMQQFQRLLGIPLPEPSGKSSRRLQGSAPEKASRKSFRSLLGSPLGGFWEVPPEASEKSLREASEKPFQRAPGIKRLPGIPLPKAFEKLIQRHLAKPFQRLLGSPSRACSRGFLKALSEAYRKSGKCFE